jgi:hypothetical protein
MGWELLLRILLFNDFSSYARGEIYRFGLVAYNNKGPTIFCKMDWRY